MLSQTAITMDSSYPVSQSGQANGAATSGGAITLEDSTPPDDPGGDLPSPGAGAIVSCDNGISLSVNAQEVSVSTPFQLTITQSEGGDDWTSVTLPANMTYMTDISDFPGNMLNTQYDESSGTLSFQWDPTAAKTSAIELITFSGDSQTITAVSGDLNGSVQIEPADTSMPNPTAEPTPDITPCATSGSSIDVTADPDPTATPDPTPDDPTDTTDLEPSPILTTPSPGSPPVSIDNGISVSVDAPQVTTGSNYTVTISQGDGGDARTSIMLSSGVIFAGSLPDNMINVDYDFDTGALSFEWDADAAQTAAIKLVTYSTDPQYIEAVSGNLSGRVDFAAGQPLIVALAASTDPVITQVYPLTSSVYAGNDMLFVAILRVTGVMTQVTNPKWNLTVSWPLGNDYYVSGISASGFTDIGTPTPLSFPRLASGTPSINSGALSYTFPSNPDFSAGVYMSIVRVGTYNGTTPGSNAARNPNPLVSLTSAFVSQEYNPASSASAQIISNYRNTFTKTALNPTVSPGGTQTFYLVFQVPTISNTPGAVMLNPNSTITIKDMFPPNFTYTAGSAVIVPGSGSLPINSVSQVTVTGVNQGAGSGAGLQFTFTVPNDKAGLTAGRDSFVKVQFSGTFTNAANNTTPRNYASCQFTYYDGYSPTLYSFVDTSVLANNPTVGLYGHYWVYPALPDTQTIPASQNWPAGRIYQDQQSQNRNRNKMNPDGNIKSGESVTSITASMWEQIRVGPSTGQTATTNRADPDYQLKMVRIDNTQYFMYGNIEIRNTSNPSVVARNLTYDPKAGATNITLDTTTDPNYAYIYVNLAANEYVQEIVMQWNNVPTTDNDANQLHMTCYWYLPLAGTYTFGDRHDIQRYTGAAAGTFASTNPGYLTYGYTQRGLSIALVSANTTPVIGVYPKFQNMDTGVLMTGRQQVQAVCTNESASQVALQLPMYVGVLLDPKIVPVGMTAGGGGSPNPANYDSARFTYSGRTLNAGGTGKTLYVFQFNNAPLVSYLNPGDSFTFWLDVDIDPTLTGTVLQAFFTPGVDFTVLNSDGSFDMSHYPQKVSNTLGVGSLGNTCTMTMDYTLGSQTYGLIAKKYVQGNNDGSNFLPPGNADQNVTDQLSAVGHTSANSTVTYKLWFKNTGIDTLDGFTIVDTFPRTGDYGITANAPSLVPLRLSDFGVNTYSASGEQSLHLTGQIPVNASTVYATGGVTTSVMNSISVQYCTSAQVLNLSNDLNTGSVNGQTYDVYVPVGAATPAWQNSVPNYAAVTAIKITFPSTFKLTQGQEGYITFTMYLSDINMPDSYNLIAWNSFAMIGWAETTMQWTKAIEPPKVGVRLTDVEIPFIKVVQNTGGLALPATNFAFHLVQVADASGTAMANPYTDAQTVTQAGGSFRFDVKNFAPGTYFFKLYEDNVTSPADWTCDTATRVVKVVIPDDNSVPTVTDVSNNAAVTSGNPLVFTNNYTKVNPVDVPVPIKKTIDNPMNFTLPGSTFTIELQEAVDQNGAVKSGGYSASKTFTQAGGSDTFTIPSLLPGTYYYLVSEDPITGAGSQNWRSETSPYVIQVVVPTTGPPTVTRVSDSSAVAAASPAEFRNKYGNNLQDVLIGGLKSVTGSPAVNPTFTYDLKLVRYLDSGGTEKTSTVPAHSDTTTTTGGGAFSFTVSLAGLPSGTYYYTVSERGGNDTGWSYDKRFYLVKVVIDASALTSAVTMYLQAGTDSANPDYNNPGTVVSGSVAAFTNIYNESGPIFPNTGGRGKALYTAMGFVVVSLAGIYSHRRRKGLRFTK